MSTGFDQGKADRLMDDAFQALDQGEPEAAFKIAKILRRMKYFGAFEVEALACSNLGQTKQAIDALQEGTEKCPDVWQLWQLLGNYLSNEERFSEAFDAYDKGLAIDESFSPSLNLNYSIGLLRSGKPTKAKSQITLVLGAPNFEEFGGSLRARIWAVNLEALRTLGKFDEAVQCFDGIKNKDYGDNSVEEVSILWTKLARSLFESGRRDEAEQGALAAA